MLHRRRRSIIWFGTAVVALTGCFTGERPTLIPQSTIDDPAAQSVLDRLDRADSARFIASYDIIPSLTGATTRATVVQLDQRRRVTIGNVEFITDGDDSQTCQSDGTGCTDFLDDARISDLSITNRFWGSGFASRLELDASRRIGPSVTATATIAARNAMCVDVIVPSVATTTGTVVYCALDDGVLARYFGADVSIELTSFSLNVSENNLDS